MSEDRQYYEVFTISEYIHERMVKNAWTRVGVAFVNKDGSFNLRLRALPVTNPKTGTADLHMRLPKPRDEGGEYEMDEGGEYEMTDYPFDPVTGMPLNEEAL